MLGRTDMLTRSQVGKRLAATTTSKYAGRVTCTELLSVNLFACCFFAEEGPERNRLLEVCRWRLRRTEPALADLVRPKS